MLYEFGPFRLDTVNFTLVREGRPIHVTPKAVDLLVALIECAGEVVRKDELRRRVWPDVAVADGSLAFHIHLLRKVLQEGGTGEPYIENVPRRGYRFVATVRSVAPAAEPLSRGHGDAIDAPSPDARPDASPDNVDGPFPQSAAGRRRLWQVLAATVAAAGAAIALASHTWPGRHPEPAPLRVSRPVALTDGRSHSAWLGPLLTDGRQVYFNPGGRLSALDLSTGVVRAVAPLVGFEVFDVSPTGREFLARKPQDPGGEHGLWVVPIEGEPRRLSDLRVTKAAAWSPRGDQVAFAFSRDLFVATADGGDVRKIVSANGNVGRVRWSPDARHLRFDVSVQANRNSTTTIWEVAVSGGAPRRLFADVLDVPHVCCGNWTPDGRGYIFQVGPFENAQLWFSRIIRPGHAGAPPTPLTDGPFTFTGPVISGDGRRVFAAGRRADGELVRLDERLGEYTPYLDGLSALWVSFARDGTWMTYQSHPDDALWRARLDGSDKRRLTTAPMRVDGSEPSPDGRWIVFRGREHDNAPLRNYILPAEGGTPVPIIDAPVTQGTASWSPDSQQLVYGDVPEKFGVPTGSEVIHLFDRRTRTVSTLPHSGGLWTARWSPDGRYIAALTIEEQRLKLYDVQSRAWRAFDIDHVTCPTWTRDSRALYLDSEGAPPRLLRRLRVADGTVERVFDLTNYPMSAYWWTGLSHDDRPILLRIRGGSQIYTLELG